MTRTVFRRDAKGRFQIQPERTGSWTQAKREGFLIHLAATCNVKRSCEAIGMTDCSANRLRKRDPEFRRARAHALSDGYAKLEMMLLERALLGETLVRDAVERYERALETLMRYPNTIALSLYRQHRAKAEAADEAADEAAVEAARERVTAKLDALVARLRREDARKAGQGDGC